MSYITKKKLLYICKENNIKNVSKLKKNDIISVLKEKNIPFLKNIKEDLILDKDIFNRKDIENKVFDKKDPISLEPFEEWTEEEFKNGLFINGYYYKRETIKQYIECKKTENITDPINPSLLIPSEIINIFSKKEEKILKENDIIIEYETSYLNLEYHTYIFTKLFIKINTPDEYKIETKLKYDQRKGRYYIGCIPNNISICSWEEYPFEIKALDTSSTTEALLIRISELYRKEKLIKIKDNKIIIEKIKSLPLRSFNWFYSINGYFLIDTTPIENRNRLSIYNSLLKELEDYD